MSTPLLKSKVVVVGASRGIGLELAKQFHALYPDKDGVVATMRKPDATLLPSEVRVEALDVADEQSVEAFAKTFESIDGPETVLHFAHVWAVEYTPYILAIGCHPNASLLYIW